MAYTKNIIILIAVTLWCGACKKAELPPTFFEDPVFMALIYVDTPGQSIKAGVNNVYLFTDFEEGDFTVCSGSFAETDCPNADCPGSLTFLFRSLMTDPFSPDTVFHTGSFLYDGPGGAADTVYLTTFNVVPGSGYNSFSWAVDSAFAGTGTSLVQQFQENVPKVVRLAAQKQSGLTSTVFRTVSLTNPGALNPVVGIDIQSDSLTYTLTAEVSGTPVSQFFWNTGDTTQEIFEFNLAQAYSIIVEDTSGNRAQARLQQLTPDEVPVSTAGFTYTVQPLVFPTQPGEVSIQWIDPQGTIWRSDLNAQLPGATFEVLESEPYEKNERGQATRKMRVAFNCLLFNDAGESLPFNGNGVIAVAHP
ncbi:MAG: hypothetical protein DYG98_18470 [Haliscomenobacteraceae bacterium CHB4]|nr:hypothetical protein [Saprospiraceae bacterium]MCE7925042.1 hypothetical protein [Haliscomenobacteraceae bacterium CHB4]